jgi:hypothetical protein
MPNATSLKHKIRQSFTVEELREMFVRRQDDHLFFKVGECLSDKNVYQSLNADEFHLVAWRGFEALTDSIYPRV